MRRSLHQTTYITMVGLAVALAPVCALQAAETDNLVALSHGSFLSVQQALEIAVKNHPMLLEGAANLKASEARTEQARSLYYPQVYANANTVAGAGVSNPRFLVGGGLLRENQSTFTGGAGAGCQRKARAGAAVRAACLSHKLKAASVGADRGRNRSRTRSNRGPD